MTKKSKTATKTTIDPFADPIPTIPRRRGRPSNHEAAPQPKKITNIPQKTTKTPINGTDPAYINNIDNTILVLSEIEKAVTELDEKTQLTAQELKFIEYHIVMGLAVVKSMKLAGYFENSDGMYFYRSKKILRRYEEREEDRRHIQRALGYGEVFVIDSMAKLAKGAKSEIARANAIATLGRWLGMDKEVLQGAGGVTIVIQAYDGAQQQINVSPTTIPRPQEALSFDHPHPSSPGGTVTITK